MDLTGADGVQTSLLRALVEGAPVALAVLGPDGAVRLANRLFLALLDDDLSAIAIDPHEERVQKLRPGELFALPAIQQDGHAVALDVFRLEGFSDVVGVIARKTVVETTKTEVTRRRSSASETGERERHREELLDRLRLILHHLPIGCVITDAHLRITKYNRAAERLLGRPSLEVLGQPRGELLPLPAGQSLQNLIEDRIERSEQISVVRYGRTVLCQCVHAPVFDGSGQFAGLMTTIVDITDRERAAERLRQSEASLAAAQEIAQVGSWEWDAGSLGHNDGGLVWSDEMYRIFGVGRDEIYLDVNEFWNRVHAEDLPRVRQAMLNAVRERVDLDIDYRISRPDGDVRIVAMQLRNRKTALRANYVIGTIRDVTEARHAEQRLQDSQERLNMALRVGNMIAILADFSEGRIELSANATEQLGLAPGNLSLSLHDALNLLHPEDAQRQLDALAVHSAVGALPYAEVRLIRPDTQEIRWFESRLSSVATADGHLKIAHGLMLDVTDRKRADDILRWSEERYRSLFEFAPEAIVTVDAENGRFLEANGNAHALFERSHPELLATSWPQLSAAKQVDGFDAEPAFHLMIHRALAGDTPTFEWRFRLGNSGDVPCEVRLVRLPGTTPPSCRATIVDIRKKKETEAQLFVADRLASIGTLAAGVAHEINNPLASIMTNLELASREVATLVLDPDSELIDEIRESREAAERVRLIVRDLKLFSRTTDEGHHPVNIESVLESTLRMAWNEIRHRARLVRDYHPIPTVQANESRLGQVFLNLVVNAAQAIAEGRAEHNEIRVSTETDDAGRAVIRIADTGAGISPEIYGRLFMPFVTTKPVGEGTGLGLSICQRIITDFGGTIDVTSELGKGTEFRIVLPVVTTANPVAATITSPILPSRPQRSRILVVDDEVPITTALRRALEPRHDVVFLNAAAEALTLIRGGARFDVIFCDLMMPQMTGMDLHAALIDSVPDMAARMVFLTGGAFTARAREFLDNVPNRRLEKPFHTSRLHALILDVAG